MHSVMSASESQDIQDVATADAVNADAPTLEEQLKRAREDLVVAERKATRAIAEAKRWHEAYEKAVQPEIRMVAGDDETLARAYVNSQDRCDMLEERVIKTESIKNKCVRSIRRQNAYIFGIKQRAKGIPIEVNSMNMKNDHDLDSRRREGWLDMDQGFPGYRLNRQRAFQQVCEARSRNK